VLVGSVVGRGEAAREAAREACAAVGEDGRREEIEWDAYHHPFTRSVATVSHAWRSSLWAKTRAFAMHDGVYAVWSCQWAHGHGRHLELEVGNVTYITRK
jgi:hypothetical protein